MRYSVQVCATFIVAVLGLLFASLPVHAANGRLEFRTLDVDGVSRTYCIYTPVRLERAPTVVFDFHGGGSTCLAAMEITGWHELADQEGFLVVAPQGLNRDWNACSRPPKICVNPIDDGPATKNGVDDVGFFVALVEAIDAEYGTSAHFVSGFSKGGMLVYHLVCHLPDLIDGALVAGTTNVSQCEPSAAVPLLIHHGADDPMVRWPEGGGLRNDWPSPFGAVEDQAYDANLCSLSAPNLIEAGTDAEVYAFTGCAAVMEIVISRCEHNWPGYVAPSWAFWGDCPANATVDLTSTAWAFFQRAHGENLDKGRGRRRSAVFSG